MTPMKQKHFFLKFTAFLLVACLAVGFIQPVQMEASASSLSDLQQQLKDLEKQQKELEKQIKDTQNKKEQQQAYQKSLVQQIKVTEEQVTVLLQRIDVLDTTIADKTKEVEQKEAEVAESMQKFEKRLRAMYMTSNTSTLSLILSADSFGELISATKYAASLADYDNQLIETLTREKDELQAAKDALEADKADLEESKKQLSAKQASLQSQYANSQATEASLGETEEEMQKKVKELQAAEEKASDEINRIIAESGNNSGDYTGGIFTWPLPGYTYISSNYGWRTLWGVKDFHRGIDISTNKLIGPTIVAAADGVVISAIYNHYSYGNYLIISHGGGISTVYAHCSALSVSAGQTVKAGQPIAKVGSTGNSSGPHLHFEVRDVRSTAIGQTVSPWIYLK